MSLELPEIKILGEQMNKRLQGKRTKSYQLRDYERLQKIGFMNKDLKAFDQLVDRRVESVVSRGNTILVKLSNAANLILGPEYGGEIRYHDKGETPLTKFHLRVDFADDSALTVRLTSMGGIYAMKDDELPHSYFYKRDFNPNVTSPTDEGFTFGGFAESLSKNDKALKSVLVGKDATLVGIRNSSFQDILYRAKLHPKRKASELNAEERRRLYDSIKHIISERIRLNGKEEFTDFYGRQGSYTPAMGPKMKGLRCTVCKTPIQKLGIGGGNVFLCPKCQAES
ncbi:MAG: DNA-formamidopyrimidine glycosylase family protein [Promethearchaeati archaeon SRVP18_Atabeyarchaeia-1]